MKKLKDEHWRENKLKDGLWRKKMIGLENIEEKKRCSLKDKIKWIENYKKWDLDNQ